MSNNNKTGADKYPPELVDAIKKNLEENHSERQFFAAAKFFDEEAKKIERGERSEFLEFVEREVQKAELKAFGKLVKKYEREERWCKDNKIEMIGFTSSGDPVSGI
jgi:hypothetical protein